MWVFQSLTELNVPQLLAAAGGGVLLVDRRTVAGRVHLEAFVLQGLQFHLGAIGKDQLPGDVAEHFLHSGAIATGCLVRGTNQRVALFAETQTGASS